MKLKYIFLAATLGLMMTSCSDFIDVDPQGVVDEKKANESPEEMVTSAYAMLGNDWYSYPFNLWPYGDLASDDCLKGGSGTTDTAITPWKYGLPLLQGPESSTSFGTISMKA